MLEAVDHERVKQNQRNFSSGEASGHRQVRSGFFTVMLPLLFLAACFGGSPEVETASSVESGLDDVYATVGDAPGWIKVRLTDVRAHKALDLKAGLELRLRAFADLVVRAERGERAQNINGLEVFASYPPFEDDVTFRKPTLILIAKVYLHPARSSLFGSTEAKPAEISWNDAVKEAIALDDKAYVDGLVAAARIDELIANSGSRDRNSFRRTGPWRASLCAMSSDSSIAGYRGGTAQLDVFEKTSGTWSRTEVTATTSGLAIRPGQNKCAELSIPHGGTFSVAVNVPSGVNYVVQIAGGGKALRLSNRR